LAFTLHVKALGLISEFQPMRSTDFDNLKQQNGLDSSYKAALRLHTLATRACSQQLIYSTQTFLISQLGTQNVGDNREICELGDDVVFNIKMIFKRHLQMKNLL
jgi:hypothetical protein